MPDQYTPKHNKDTGPGADLISESVCECMNAWMMEDTKCTFIDFTAPKPLDKGKENYTKLL